MLEARTSFPAFFVVHLLSQPCSNASCSVQPRTVLFLTIPSVNIEPDSPFVCERNESAQPVCRLIFTSCVYRTLSTRELSARLCHRSVIRYREPGRLSERLEGVDYFSCDSKEPPPPPRKRRLSALSML